jgi:hypothetical protein
MNLRINTRYEELSLAIQLQTLSPSKIRIKVYDAEKPKTVFTDRYKTVKGNEVFYIRMPLSSNKVIVSVYNEAVGNKRKGEDKSFIVTEVKKLPLQKRTDVGDIRDYTVSSFVDFAQRFSFNASYLEDDKTYQSQNGEFLIEYLPVIVSGKSGKKLKTPARISKVNGRIQVSKEAFEGYTVPMRMAILLHEFSHFYLNDNMDDEIEADLNGLLIYLGLGYPRIEGYQAFLEVFQESPSEQNKKRYDIINKFIRDFENNKMIMN